MRLDFDSEDDWTPYSSEDEYSEMKTMTNRMLMFLLVE